jgi:hypothetical protein
LYNSSGVRGLGEFDDKYVNGTAEVL